MGDETVLGFKVTGVESLDALTESVQNIQGALGDLAKQRFSIGDPRKAEEEVRKVRKAIAGVVKEYEHAAEISKSKGFGLLPGKKQAAELTKIARQVKREEQAILAIREQMARLAEDDPRRQIAKEEIARLQKIVKIQTSNAAVQTKLLDKQTARHMESVNEVEEFRKRRFSEHAKDMASEAEKAFKSVASADPFGFSDALSALGSQASMAFKSKAAEKSEQGKGGQAMAYKALSKAASAMSKAAKAVGAMRGIWDTIKDAMDMQADLNAQIYDSTGSLALFGDTWGKVGTGIERARNLVGQITKEVSDWGTMYDTNLSPQEQMELLATFERQNMTIKEMADNIESGSSGMKKFTDYTWMAVRLQKNLGLEMSETVEAISFFTKDMGVSLKDVDRAFHQIAQNAIEANMNTRDFFATVMQVSSNMALYGNRVAEVAVLLNKLGKALGPQQAKQALQGIVDQWRQMGDEQRIQMTLLAGTGTVLKRVRADARGQFENMRKDIEAQMGEGGPLANMWSGSKQITAKNMQAEDIASITDEQIAALNNGTEEQRRLGRSIESLRAMQREANKGGVTGAANAMAFAGPGAGMQAFNDIAEKRFGKPLNEMTGLQAIAYRKLTGIGLDQFRQLQALQTQFRGEITNLVSAVNMDTLGQGELTDEQKVQFEKLASVMGKTTEQLRAEFQKNGGDMVSEQEYLSSLTKEQQDKALENSDVMETTAEQHLNETRKISKLLENIISKVLLEIAQFISGIWDTIVGFFSKWDKKDALQRLQEAESGTAQELDTLRRQMIEEKDEDKKKGLKDDIKKLEMQRADIAKLKAQVGSGAISSADELVKAMRGKGLTGGATGRILDEKGEAAVETMTRTFANVLHEELKPGQMIESIKQMSTSDVLTPSLVPAYYGKKAEEGGFLGIGETEIYGAMEAEGQLGARPTSIAEAMEWKGLQVAAASPGMGEAEDAFLNPQWVKRMTAVQSLFGGGLYGAGEKTKAKMAGDTETYERLDVLQKSGNESSEKFIKWQQRMYDNAKAQGMSDDDAAAFTRGAVDEVANGLLQLPIEMRAQAMKESESLLTEIAKSGGITDKFWANIDWRGMKLDKDEPVDIANEIVRAQEAAEARRLATELGVATDTGNINEEALKALATTDQNAAQLRRLRALVEQYGGVEKLKVEDAYFPKGGLAHLAAGDYVINRQAFEGPSMRGGKGAMLSQAVTAGAGGGAATGNVTIVNNINGGDTARIQQLIVEQIRYIERRRAAGQSV